MLQRTRNPGPAFQGSRMSGQMVCEDRRHNHNTRLHYTLKLQSVLKAISLTLFPHSSSGQGLPPAPRHTGNVVCVIILLLGHQASQRSRALLQ